MKRLLVAVALVACTPPRRTPPLPPTNPRQVYTTEGRVTGEVDADGLKQFLGVPFAAPPVGPLRWREAQPPAPYTHVDATRFRLPCSQIPIPEGSDALGSGKRIPTSEDCLYANLWVPPHEPGTRLPVMVWLHGGQYLRGATSQYDGAQLARLGHVVVVTVAYRLGPLGFLAHPALTAESPLHSSGNQALFDHLQALRWLHANAAAFDGDPERITLFGESAGSASTCALMASPLARGLFHRAILQSTACPGEDETDIPTLASREAFGKKLAAALGCARDAAADELACMRGKTEDEILTAIPLGKVLNEESGGVGYRFNVDGAFLTTTPAKAMAAGAIAKLPVLLGTTDDEMGRYVGAYGVETPDDLRAVVAKEFVGHAEAIAAAYPAATPADAKRQLAALFSDWANTCPIRRDARAFAALGMPTFLYRWRHAPDVFERRHGAFHGSELAYLFPSVFAKHGLVVTDDDRAIAALLAGYWGRFAATGDPNGADAPRWPRYDATGDALLAIDAATTTHVEPHLRATECDVWDRTGL